MRIYLDYNATSKVLPSVKEHVGEWVDTFGNPSSVYKEGRKARQLVEETRRFLAKDVGALRDQVLFTSGATEANATILKTFVGKVPIWVSGVEHSSVRFGVDDLGVIPVLPDGTVDLEALETLLATSKEPALVSVMMVNNETGVIQPIDEVSLLVKKYHGFLHVDAVQGYKKCDIHFNDSDIDFMTISGHKIGALKGVGALFAKDVSQLEALIRGGGQERYFRSGTENVVGIASFGMAAQDERSSWGHVRRWRDHMEERLRALFPDIVFFGEKAERVASCSSFAVPSVDVDAQMQLIAMDQKGVCISSGSACSAGRISKSHVLDAMGVADDLAMKAVRVSLGWDTKEEDIECFVHAYASFLRHSV